jgi:hypothetical protein
VSSRDPTTDCLQASLGPRRPDWPLLQRTDIFSVSSPRLLITGAGSVTAMDMLCEGDAISGGVHGVVAETRASSWRHVPRSLQALVVASSLQMGRV